ncbi:VAO15-like protein [Mya arenaria]|uniref:VAO15-like protein n=1 Tax=Mya arenaria TaxID=6604 RepID=A0ABY7FJD0_MYAAR|nr:VAO15-like protein [Mya arenaria]
MNVFQLNAVGRVVVGGSAHTVTPGGYTLGGGHSPVSRSLGYAVDNLLEAQVVLADGSIITATENRTVIVTPEGDIIYHENGDLFWALRGGGGVFEQQLEKMPPTWGGYRMLNNFPGSFEDPGSKTIINYKGLLTFYFNKFAPWDGSEHKELEAAVNWARSNFGSGMYLNEPWKDNPYWKEDFWGTENYERLLLIKRRYDPDNFFTCLHCVGSDVMDKTDPRPAPPVGHAFTCLASWSLHSVDVVPPNVDGVAPHVGGVAPNVDVVPPNIDGVAPSVGDVAPNVDGVAPNVGGVAPNFGGAAPNVGGVAPVVDLDPPNVDDLAPNVGGVAPNYGGVAPNVDGIAPNVDGVAPNFGGVAPDVGGVAPNVGGVAPNVDGVAPNVGDVALNLGGVAPNVGGVPTNVGGVAPNVGGVAPTEYSVANIFKANEHFSSNRYIHFLFSLYEFAFSDSCPE